MNRKIAKFLSILIILWKYVTTVKYTQLFNHSSAMRNKNIRI